jgi:hypothetical protein
MEEMTECHLDDEETDNEVASRTQTLPLIAHLHKIQTNQVKLG